VGKPLAAVCLRCV